jgi:membrane-associated protease RseP (regulator of RpoE activity)
MASSTRKKAPTRAKAARRAAVPAANPPPAIDPAPPAQASQRRSPWKAVAIVVGALAVLAVVFGAGGVVGYGFARAGGAFGLRTFAFPLFFRVQPYGGMMQPGDDWVQPFGGMMQPYGGRVQPYDEFGCLPHNRLGPLEAGAAYLGITYSQADQGAKVSEVISGSPAEDAGLQPGDVILAVEGFELTQPALLRHLIRTHAPGDEVTLLVLRQGEERKVVVTLGLAPDPTGQ